MTAVSVDIAIRAGTLGLDIRFEAPAGVTVLFGPSGAGKTTILRAVAGLARPDTGRIDVGGRVLFDAATGVNLRPETRAVGYVFQDARLFPHLTVLQNLRYGGRHDEDRVIGLLGLETLLDRRPAGLSGGEKSRVALGRALMRNPDVLLLDEPLAALDAPRKAEVLPYLEALAAEDGPPMLYVTHAIDELARLARTVAVVDGGRIAASGPVEQVLADPALAPLFGPRDAGAVIRGRVAGRDAGQGLTEVTFDGGRLWLPGRVGEMGAPIRLRVPASDVILAAEKPAGLSALNILPVEVVSVVPGRGPGVAVGLACGATRLLARVTARSAVALGLEPGARVWAIIKATAIPGTG